MSLFSTRQPTIQARISALVVACILPAALAATLLLYHDFRMERANIERSKMDTARALSQAIDRELIGAEATLQVLSSSLYLRNADLHAFYLQIQEILRGVPGTTFLLSTPNGQQLINTLLPFGHTLPLNGDVNHFDRVLAAEHPVISDLFVGATTHRQLVAVELAMRHNGKPTYVLSMGFLTERFSEILEHQRLPKDQVISILDSTGTIIADNNQDRQLIGSKIDPDLFERMKGRTEGTIKVDSPKKASKMLAFSRSGVSNWTLVISTPSDAVVSVLWESISLIATGTLLLLAIGLALAQIIGGQISRSITGLVAPALALGHGNVVVVPDFQLREADAVGQALIKAAKLVHQRTLERDLATQAAQHIREIKQKFEYQAYHDALTGLPNRTLFYKFIKSGIETCHKECENLVVFYIDVDDFKRINDLHGHFVGDELLRLFANRLKAGLRESDVTARLGGDEFAAILMQTNLEHAQATAQALVGALSHPYMIGELTVTTSASIGIAAYPESGSTPEELINLADQAMYRAKTDGKNRCFVFTRSGTDGTTT